MSDLRPDDIERDDHIDVPPDFQTLHEWLNRDGARWRGDLPDGRALSRWARVTLPGSAAHEQGEPPIGRTRYLNDRTKGFSRPSKGLPAPMPNTRLRGFAGTAAALVVVGLIALLLAHNAANRGTGAKADATPTLTTPLTPSPVISCAPSQAQASPQASAQQPSLQTGEFPVVAPSNPCIVYRVLLRKSSQAPSNGSQYTPQPQRSIDGGVTFTNLPEPKANLFVDDGWITVSPLDASHVFLSVTGGAAVGSVDFYSANGGQSWAPLKLPFAGVLGSVNGLRLTPTAYADAAYVMQAQGQRLYASGGVSSQQGMILMSEGARLLTSVDGGASWSLIDQQLTNAGLNVCDFAAAPTGSTVYAITADQSCGNEGAPVITLWRSDNAGQSWTRVRELSSPAEAGLAVSRSGALYIYMPAATIQNHAIAVDESARYVEVSLDGGKNFTSAPSAGLGASGLPSGGRLTGPLAMLSDGSVIFAYTVIVQGQPVSALYAWKAGDAAWRRLGGPSGGVGSVTVTPQSSGDRLTIVDWKGAISTLTVHG